MRELATWVLIGAAIIFSITTILAASGLEAALGENEEVLFFLRVVSLFASLASAVSLMVMPASNMRPPW
jgi:hypothetical protein